MVTITEVLNMWQYQGVFAYVLPFLMIFAVVYGILDTSKILGSNRGVHTIIAATLGLLALQYDYVSMFFATIFPYTGIGIAVVLVALILMSAFIPEGDNKRKWIFFWIGLVVFLVILLSTFTDFAWWGGGYGFADSWPAMLIGILVIAGLAWVVFGGQGGRGG